MGWWACATSAAGGGDSDGDDTDASTNVVDASSNIDASQLCVGVTCEQGTCNGATGDCDCNSGWEGDTCDTVIEPPMGNLLLWLDANDTNGNGNAQALGALDVWVDKAGNVANFTQTGDERPTLIDSVNGLKSVSFDGTDDWMGGGVFSEITDKFAYTVVIVGRGGDDDNAFLAGTETTNDNPGLLIETATDGNVRSLHRMPFGESGGDDISTTNDALKSDALNRIWISRDASATPDIDIFINDEIGLSSVGAADDLDEDINLAIGRENIATDSRYLTGEIAEILIYLGAQTPNSNAELETYLQNKWGVE